MKMLISIGNELFFDYYALNPNKERKKFRKMRVSAATAAAEDLSI